MNNKISKKASSIVSSVTLAIDTKQKNMISDGIEVYGFVAGEPDFDTPKYICEAAKDALDKGMTRYVAVQGTLELRKAICSKLKRENNVEYTPDNILTSSGAKHSLSNVFAAILDNEDEVIVPAPYWVSYTEIIKLNDGIPVIVSTKIENGFKITPDELKSAITKKTKALLINNPNNPTGSVYTYDELVALSNIAIENNLYIISDEIYERLVYDGKNHISISSLTEKIKEKTILINGMSKSYAMTGWRLGYIAANEHLIKAMSAVQSHAVSHPSTITQYAASVALNGPQDDLKRMVVEFEKRRNYMFQKLSEIEGFKCIKPEGAFYVFSDISALYGKNLCGEILTNSVQFANILLEKAHVAVVPGSAFGIEGFIRMSYATSMNNIIKGLEVLKTFLRENLT